MSTRKPRVPIMMRLPDDLHEQLRAYAEQTVRSVNSSAEVLLKRALDQAAAAGEYAPAEPDTAGGYAEDDWPEQAQPGGAR